MGSVNKKVIKEVAKAEGEIGREGEV